MGELIAAIVDVIARLWDAIYVVLPIKSVIVRGGESGVRFTWGRPGKKTLLPGLHFATLGQTLEACHTRLCVSGIDDIYTTLKDGTPICVDGVLTYAVDNLGDFLINSEDTDLLVSEYAEATLRATLAELDFAEFHGEPKKLDQRIRTELQKMCKQSDLGVNIKYYRIKTFEVTCPTSRTALAVPMLVAAMGRIPDSEAKRVGYMGRVALMASAQPVNDLAGVEAEPEQEDE